LSQGKPVIAGLDEWNVKWIKGFSYSDTIPWLIVQNKEMLSKKIIQLMDPVVRLEIGLNSRRFMERFWNDEKVVGNLVDFYKSCAN
jgi:hypothetical protein